MLRADGLIGDAIAQTGHDDFGGATFRIGLDQLTSSLNESADLTELGTDILAMRLRGLLANRLRIENIYRLSPEIGDERVEGPVFVVGLPRTGTTALSQLVAADPQIRSLRVWESADPVPPPEAATQHNDPRIAATAEGLELMYATFPRMRSLHNETATGATECQDLLGMEFATAHFDGMARVPAYMRWVVSANMRPAYEYHRRVLRLLQWHCPPRLWHLKTPVHLLSLDAIIDVYPEARFLWSHRDPAEVIGSVCDLIAYIRSWASDRDDREELGQQQVEHWAEALRRGLAFRASGHEHRFADVHFAELNADPVGTVERAYDRIGLSLSGVGADRMRAWAADNARGSQGAHEYSLADFGLVAEEIRRNFAFYLERFPA
jgi:hypothetical protein